MYIFMSMLMSMSMLCMCSACSGYRVCLCICTCRHMLYVVVDMSQSPLPDVLDTTTQSGAALLQAAPCFQRLASNALLPTPCFQRLVSNALFPTPCFQRCPPLPQKNALNVRQPRRHLPPPAAAATCRHLPPPPPAATCPLTSAKLLLPHLVVLRVQVLFVLFVWGGLGI